MACGGIAQAVAKARELNPGKRVEVEVENLDELQQALATPPAGRPDCAREPLPGGALRLLQPTHHRGENPGGQAPTAAGAGAPLPGA